MKKLKFLLKEFQFILLLKFGGACHTLSAMLLYQLRHKYVTVATMTSDCRLSDVIEITSYQGTEHTSLQYHCFYGNRSVV